tara:strand:- start:979 stop:1314 length:336 start_codon:yes stop_codon:yes gene_type:complete
MSYAQSVLIINMKLIVFFLITYGIANIMIFSSIFNRWRNFWDKISPNFFGELFKCMICLPFWIGIFLSFSGFSISGFYFDILSIYFSAFIDGCLASGGVWLIHTLQEKLEK